MRLLLIVYVYTMANFFKIKKLKKKYDVFDK